MVEGLADEAERQAGGARKLGCAGGLLTLAVLVALPASILVGGSVVGHLYYLVDGRAADAAQYAAKAGVQLSPGEETLGSLQTKLGPAAHQSRVGDVVNKSSYCWYRDCKVEAGVLDDGTVVSLVVSDGGIYSDPVFQGTLGGLRIGGPAPSSGDSGGEDPGFFWSAKDGRITRIGYREATSETPL
jgi:hypothetical protein